jgi:hydroxymethylpyrimidine/phosphomethylpyrimidine kinase
MMSVARAGRPGRLRLLTIAGSDSGGGAGIQADLKTFAAFGGYGMSAVTAVTAQNTLRVAGVRLLAPAFVAAQIDAVASDIGVDGAKTGMLGSAAIVRAVARAVRRHSIAPLVVDPVMVAKSGDRLLARAAIASLERHLLPLATLITPNLAEAAVLGRGRVRSPRHMEEVAERLHVATGVAVLVKGGHLRGVPIDVLAAPSGLTRFVGHRQPRRATHGAGCTLSAAIAALLAAGSSLEDAIAEAKAFLERAMAAAPRLGAGAYPPDHLWRVAPARPFGRRRPVAGSRASGEPR